MRTVTRVESNIEDLSFGYWVPDETGEDGDWVTVTTPSEVIAAAEFLGCSERLVDALVQLAEAIKEALSVDLADIWNKLE